MRREPAARRAARFRRVVLKLSGLCFAPAEGIGIELGRVQGIAKELKAVSEAGVQLGVVVGGGNILRGKKTCGDGLGRCAADYMGMLATVVNGLALQDELEALGAEARLQTGLEMPRVAEAFNERRALGHLEEGRILVLAGGTGNPYFSTDTAAALRSLQIGAEVLLKGTDVDGVYDKDPKEHPDARLLRRVDFDTALRRGFGVMDSTAFSLCRDNGLPIILFNAQKDPGNIGRVVFGEEVGSVVGSLKDA